MPLEPLTLSICRNTVRRGFRIVSDKPGVGEHRIPPTLEPRFTGLKMMGLYAELGIRIAERSFEEMKRHDLEVERLLSEVRDRLPTGMGVGTISFPVPNAQSNTTSG